MRLRQLEYFVAVAEAHSITQAAAGLIVAQPSLSQQISALEAEVGTPLFDRLPRGVRLTPSGRAFLVEARAVLAAVERAEQAAISAAGGRSGEMSVATLGSLAVGLLPRISTAWKNSHPDIDLRLVEFSHADRLEDLVGSGGADLGLATEPHGQMEEVAHLGQEELLFVLPRTDPLAAEASITPPQLADRRWVMFDPSHGLHQAARRVCSLWGVRPREAIQTSQTEAAVRLAAAGVGPALVPDNVIDFESPDYVAVPCTQRLLRRIAIYSRGPMGSVGREFADVARNALEATPHLPLAEAEDRLYL